MPVPTSYTETQLAAFMVAELSDVGGALGWVADSGAFPGATPPTVVEGVYDCALALIVTDVANVLVDDVPKLRAVAKVMAWRAAKKALASRIDVSEDGQSFKLSQLYTQASANLDEARVALSEFDADDNDIFIGTLKRDINPYARENIAGVGEV